MNTQEIKNLISLAGALMERRELDSAEKIYRRILALNTAHGLATHQLGIIAHLRGDNPAAIGLMRQAIDLEPDNDFLKKNFNAFLHAARMPPPWLEPEIYDHANQRLVKRFMPNESNTYLYVIEVAGSCHLRCPSCPVGNFTEANRPKGMMDIGLFQRILEKIEHEKTVDKPKVWLFNWGEPTLNPHLPEMIRRLRELEFPVMLSSNLSLERDWKEVIRAEPDAFKISISGFSQSTYGQTHVKGNIHLVKSNMYRFRYLIDKYKARTKVWVGFHLYRHNVAEHDLMMALCKELDFDFHPIAAFYQPLEKQIMIAEHGVPATERDFMKHFLVHPVEMLSLRAQYHDKTFDCEGRFNMTAINHDGSLALCCGVYDKSNMLDADFLVTEPHEIESLKYRHPFCAKCYQYGLSLSPMPKEYDDIISAKVQAAIQACRQPGHGSSD